MNNKADVVVRLIAKDEGLKKTLSEAGPAGQKALRQIERAAAKTKPSLKAVDNVTNDIKQSMNGLLDRLGPVGSALRGLGPVGAGVGVTLAAITVGAIAAADAGQKAAAAIAAIGDEADKLNLTTDAYQALRFEADGLRITTEALNSAIQTADKTTSEAAQGTGEFFSNLVNLNPEMVKQVQNADSLTDRLDAVAKGYRAAETEVERNTILLRTFGDNGIVAGKALLTLEDGIEGATNRARAAGVVFTEDLIKASQEASAAIAQADRKVEASKLRLGANFKDFTVSVKEGQVFLINQLASLAPAETIEDEVFKIEQARARLIASQTSAGVPPAIRALFGLNFKNRFRDLTQQLEDARAKIAAAAENDATFETSFIIAPPSEDENVEVTVALKASLNRLRKEAQTNAERLSAAIKDLDKARTEGLITSDAEYNRLRQTLTERFKTVEAIKKEREAANKLERQRQDNIRAMQQASAIRESLATVTEKVAAKESELNALVASGNLTIDERNRALTQFREALDGTVEARDKLTQAFQASLDPITRFNAETKALTDLQMLANIPAKEFNQILAARSEELAKLKQEQQDQAEVDQFGETLESAEERIKQSLLTAQEVIDAKIAVEQEIVDALVSEGVLSSDQALERINQYRDELEGITNQTGQLSIANDVLGQAINGLTDGMSEFEKIGVQALLAIGAEAFGLQDQLGGILGGGFGGGGQSGGLGNIFGSILAGVFHNGSRSVGRTNSTRRRVSPAIFSNAPRFHNGTARVARDEVPAILRVGERVSTESETRELVNAINRSTALSAISGVSGGEMRVTVNNFGNDEVTTQEREGPDGNRELMIEIGKRMPRMVLDVLSGPDGQRVMRDTFSLRPRFGN